MTIIMVKRNVQNAFKMFVLYEYGNRNDQFFISLFTLKCYVKKRHILNFHRYRALSNLSNFCEVLRAAYH